MTGKFVSYGKDYSADYSGTIQYVVLNRTHDGYELEVQDQTGNTSSIVNLKKELKRCNYIIQVIAYDKGATKSELTAWKKEHCGFVNTLNYSRSLVDIFLVDGSEIVMYIPSFCIQDFVNMMLANQNTEDTKEEDFGSNSGDVIDRW